VAFVVRLSSSPLPSGGRINTISEDHLAIHQGEETPVRVDDQASILVENVMEVREAVRTALNYVKEVYADENLSNLGLEEVEYVPERHEWLVTVGFSRPWDYPKKEAPYMVLPLGGSERPPSRAYKVVHIDDTTGRILEMKHRLIPETAEA
jgi:hypothetical protein